VWASTSTPPHKPYSTVPRSGPVGYDSPMSHCAVLCAVGCVLCGLCGVVCCVQPVAKLVAAQIFIQATSTP
jgi:hypothetical protein